MAYLLSAICGTPISLAQEPQPQPAITGRDFAGLRLSVTPQQGDLTLAASRAHVWTEQPQAAGIFPGSTLGGPVHRMLLRGDVRVNMGLYSFAAARAVVWVERLDTPSQREGAGGGQPPTDAPATPQKHLHQVAIYFDRVSDAGGQVAGPGMHQSGDRLLVTGLIEGDLTLRADSHVQGRPTDDFLTEAEARLQRLLTQLAGAEEPPPTQPAVPGQEPRPPAGAALIPGMSQPFEPGSPLARRPDAASLPPLNPDLGPAERTPPIFAKGGIFTIAPGEATIITDGPEPAVILTPRADAQGVVVQYSDTRTDRQLQISAQRAVIFFEPGPLTDFARTPADKVRGIYLEGNVVATDGRYNLRGAKVYYDVQNKRAYVADAVFWTYDARRGLPLYVRAKALMQTAANQVKGEGVTLANSSFFEPHLSIGASSITITRDQPPGELPRTHVSAHGVTLNASKAPFFFFPRFTGNIERFPLRDVRMENSSDSGFAIKTSWNLFALLGLEDPPGVSIDFLLDGYLRRGVALGAEGRYAVGSQVGNFLAYLIPDDHGRDTLTSGARIRHEGDTRGVLLLEHRWDLDEKWSLFLEGSYISDETFIDAFYEPLAETRREFTTSAYLRRLDANSALSILAKGNLNDFIANEYLLQSQAYTVQKLPEIDYARVADSLFGGALLWTSDFRFSSMSMNFPRTTPAQIGFNTPALSMAAFGLAPTDRFDAALRAAGLTEDGVLRFDTRHELSTRLDLGPVRITPFAVGRFTAYDNDFAAFAQRDHEQYRYWFGGGVRAATSLQHVDDSAESRLFDIHRIRHIIEPNLTAWSSGTNVESRDLPVYDETVENIADGSAVKFGLNQTWQTQRGGGGGEGRWRTVDMLKLNAELVYASQDAPRKSPIGRFFDYRPEFSALGDFANISAAWQVTDAVGLTASEVYDLELHQSARTTAGGIIQHSADFSTFAEVHYLNPRDSTFVTVGAEYRLTRKWTTSVAATYDVDATDFQELGARFNREFPTALVSLKIRYNNITDEVAFGLVIQPKFGDERLIQLRRLGRDQLDLGEIPDDAITPGGNSRANDAGGGLLP